MTRQEKSLEKKKLGRPAIGKGLQFNAMLRPEMAAAIDAWIAAQPEPRPTRPEAIRRLLAEALGKPADAGSIPIEDLNASNDE
jgi:hypothetical protein